MVNFIMKRLNDKIWIQNALIEIIGDIWMILLGLVAGVIVKVFIIRL